MKIINGQRFHSFELSENSIGVIHKMALSAMAPFQSLLDEMAPQLPQPSKFKHPETDSPMSEAERASTEFHRG